MTDHNEFNDTLLIGKIGEARVSDYLKYRGFEILERSEGNQPDYDIKYSSQSYIRMVEVKTCTHHSSNIPIEFESRGKDSGINSGKSEIFAVYRKQYDKMFCARVEDIKKLIEELNPRVVKNTKNNSETYCYLIPESEWKLTKIDLSEIPRLEVNFDYSTGKEITLEIAQ